MVASDDDRGHDERPESVHGQRAQHDLGNKQRTGDRRVIGGGNTRSPATRHQESQPRDRRTGQQPEPGRNHGGQLHHGALAADGAARADRQQRRRASQQRAPQADAAISDQHRLHVVGDFQRDKPAAEDVQHPAGQRAANHRNQRAMPPHEFRCPVDESRGLTGEHQLQQPDTLAERHTGEGAADADQRRPENDAREILVSKQDQPQPREQRQRYTRDFSCLYVHRAGRTPGAV